MKRIIALAVIIILSVVAILFYSNVEKNFELEAEFYDFPVPKNAVIESEDQTSKNYRWESSTGTDIPISYKLMIKKSGWKQKEIDGHNIIYTKEKATINLTLAPDYIGILKSN